MPIRKNIFHLMILLFTVGIIGAGICFYLPSKKKLAAAKNQLSTEKVEKLIRQAEILIDQDKLDHAYKILCSANNLQNIDTKYKAQIWLLQGRTFLFRNKPEAALPYYFKALKYSKSLKDSTQIGSAYYDIACVFNIVKDYDRAVSFADSVTSYNKSLVQQINVSGLKTNIYSLSNRYSKAIQYGIQTEELMKNSNEDPARKMVVLSIIAESYLNLNQINNGQPYLNQAINLRKTALYNYDIAEVDITRAGYANHQKNYRKAVNLLSYLLKDGNSEMIHLKGARIYSRLSEAYAGLGDFERAYNFQNQATKQFLNLKKEADFYAVARKDAEHYLSEKDNVIAKDKFAMLDQNKRLHNRNMISLALAIFIFFLGILIWLVRMNYNGKKKLYEERLKNHESLRIQKGQEVNLALVEAGIQGEERERERIAQELHDSVAGELLVMKLNLKSLEKQDLHTGKTQLYYQLINQIGEIADKVRTTAHNLMPTELSNKGLFESIRSFLKEIRNDDLQFTGQFYGTLPPVKKQVEKIIFFVILELIQNVIKHSQAKSALVQLSFANDVLSITVEDSGIGYDDNGGNRKQGLGIMKIREQIEVLGGEIDFRSEKGIGTTIFIEIPLSPFFLD
jgi:signal transduction histidine kinase